MVGIFDVQCVRAAWNRLGTMQLGAGLVGGALSIEAHKGAPFGIPVLVAHEEDLLDCSKGRKQRLNVGLGYGREDERVRGHVGVGGREESLGRWWRGSSPEEKGTMPTKSLCPPLASLCFCTFAAAGRGNPTPFSPWLERCEEVLRSLTAQVVVLHERCELSSLLNPPIPAASGAVCVSAPSVEGSTLIAGEWTSPSHLGLDESGSNLDDCSGQSLSASQGAQRARLTGLATSGGLTSLLRRSKPPMWRRYQQPAKFLNS